MRMITVKWDERFILVDADEILYAYESTRFNSVKIYFKGGGSQGWEGLSMDDLLRKIALTEKPSYR